MRTEYLLEKEVERVLDLLTVENRLVLRVLLHTGLRISDALQLRPDQLKPNFWITEQKTGKRRQIGLPEPLLSDLLDHSGECWVFPGADPRKHRSRQAVWKDVKRAAAVWRLPRGRGVLLQVHRQGGRGAAARPMVLQRRGAARAPQDLRRSRLSELWRRL